MVTDDIIKGVDADITAVFSELEDRLVFSLCKELAKGIEAANFNAIAWKTSKLMQMGSNRIKRKLLKDTGVSEGMAKVVSAVKKALMEGDDEDAIRSGIGIAKASKLTADRRLFKAAVEGVAANARGTLNLVNTSAIPAISSAWVRAVNIAYVGVQSGTMSVAEAIRKACDDIGKRGIPVQYRSAAGRFTTAQLDVMVRRAVVTSMTQASSKLSLGRCEEYGTDLVEVSQHAESRPEHFGFQGGVFSLSGKHPRYPAFYASTHYGEPDGLCGINCRHCFWPFFEDLSSQQEPLHVSEEENKKSYEEAQKQRHYERKLRNEKRLHSAYKGGGFKEEAREVWSKHRETLAEYDRFLHETGRIRKTAREVGRSRNEALDKSFQMTYHQMKVAKLNADKQARHFKDSPSYKAGGSYLYGDMNTAKELYRRHHGKGRFVYDKNGRFQNKEVVSANRKIGVGIDKAGKMFQTSSMTIHYSRTGAHIVPGRGRTWS